MSKKAIVAFSGGLDTSMLVPYVKEKYGFDKVVTCVVDTGGMNDTEIKAVESRAHEVGSDEHIYIDASNDFYNGIIKYLIFGNVTRDGYPLCVGSERLIQAREVVKAAREKDIDVVVHGSTGAGNDQYRFDLVAYVLGQGQDGGKESKISILAPVRDDEIKREFSQDYLRKKNIPVSEKTAYSYNAGLWGTSIGGKETHTAEGLLPDHAWYSSIDTALQDVVVELDFVKGEPSLLRHDKQEIKSALAIIKYLAKLGGSMGIGRHYHVGTSIPGKKGRVAYESPAADILYEAHTTLEKITLTQQQIFFKKLVGNEFGRLVHEAKFFDPLLEDLKAFLHSSQHRVTGTCKIHLKQGCILAVTVKSPFDLLSVSGSLYGEHADFYSAQDALGSSKINAYEQVIYHKFGK